MYHDLFQWSKVAFLVCGLCLLLTFCSFFFLHFTFHLWNVGLKTPVFENCKMLKKNPIHQVHFLEENLFKFDQTVIGPATGTKGSKSCPKSSCTHTAWYETWGSAGETCAGVCVRVPPATGQGCFMDACQRTAWPSPWKYLPQGFKK